MQLICKDQYDFYKAVRLKKTGHPRLSPKDDLTIHAFAAGHVRSMKAFYISRAGPFLSQLDAFKIKFSSFFIISALISLNL